MSIGTPFQHVYLEVSRYRENERNMYDITQVNCPVMRCYIASLSGINEVK